MRSLCNFFVWVWSSYVRPVVSGFRDLFIPVLCPVCGDVLGTGHGYFCTGCLADIPFTRYWERYDNPLFVRASENVPSIVSASSLLYYGHCDGWRRLIHGLKYHGEWRHGVLLGRWLGALMLEHSRAAGAIDFVIAIPLHPYRMLTRGYNQADYIACGLASALGVPHVRRGLDRVRSNVSQVTLPHHSRFLNTENLFAVTDLELFRDRDILLVDDVYTTGSTMLSCAEAIAAAVPTCRIHIAPLALSRHFFSPDS